MMKKFWISTLFVTFLVQDLAVCQMTTVTISGNVIGSEQDSLYYSLPIAGTQNFGWSRKVKIDSSGVINLVLELDEPGLVSLSAGVIFCSPGHSYEFEMDMTSKKFSVWGKDQIGQEFLNGLPRNWGWFGVHMGAKPYLKDTVNWQQRIEDTKGKELKELTELYNQNKLSEPFYQVVNNDIKYFYAAVKARTLYFKSNDVIKMRGDDLLGEIPFDNNWRELYEKAPYNSKDALKSFWWFDYTQNYTMNYKGFLEQMVSGELTKDKIAKMRKEETFDLFMVTNVKEYLTGKYLEFYLARHLHFEGVQKHYARGLLSVYNDFRKNYPKSSFNEWVIGKAGSIVEFYKKSENEFAPEVKFIPNNDINTIHDLIDQFKGKQLFIDVWATWCGPCKKEFAFNKPLKKFLKEEGVEMLYITIDDEKRKVKWKEMIKFYNLEGSHYFPNEGFVSDLRDLFGEGGRLTIPWYIIVNKNGNIKVKHANTPSSKGDLYQQIKNVLKDI